MIPECWRRLQDRQKVCGQLGYGWVRLYEFICKSRTTHAIPADLGCRQARSGGFWSGGLREGGIQVGQHKWAESACGFSNSIQLLLGKRRLFPRIPAPPRPPAAPAEPQPIHLHRTIHVRVYEYSPFRPILESHDYQSCTANRNSQSGIPYVTAQ